MSQMVLANVKDVSEEIKHFRFSFPNSICFFSFHIQLKKKNLYTWMQKTP